MNTNRIAITLVCFSCCLFTVDQAVGLDINLNFGTAATGTSTPGGLISGVVNDVPLGGSGTIVDSNGAATTVTVTDTTANWAGDNNNDGDAKFDAAAATYTDAVARSLFWGGDDSTVTIQGLDANTNYAVGIVSASTNADVTHDWFFNGSQVADDLAETEGNTSIPFFSGTTDGAGDLVVLSNDHQGTVGLLQALVLTDNPGFLTDPVSLVVNTTSGGVTLKSNSVSEFISDVKGYSILSDSGSLNPNNWSSLQEQGQGDQGAGDGNTDPSDGVGWEQLGDGTSSGIGEFNLLSHTLMGSGIELDLSLGNLFTGGTDVGLQDLVLELELADGNFQRLAATYEAGLPGDFDGDGRVTGSDFLVWQRTDGSASGLADWEANYGTGAPVSALTAVPEPSSLVIVGLAIAASIFARGRRSKCHSNV